MGKILQFIKQPKLSIAEYGKVLWDSIFNQEPETNICPKCGYKLQWIRIDKYISYWGCMKCKLRTVKTIQGVEVGYKASL